MKNLSYLLSRFVRHSRALNTNNFRRISTGSSITFDEFGDPLKVLRKVEFAVPENVDENKILVKLLAAPVNPADINTIQGVYGIKPKLPAVAGFEGVAEVLKVGKGVTKLSPGDWVIPTAGSTWNTHSVWDQEEIIKVSNDIPVTSAATLSVNPSTAYRLLKDFVKLEKGDVVLQNGANSGVGQHVIQLCRHYGYVSVNVIRNRPDLDKVRDYLTQIGANYVITEEDLRNNDSMNFMKTLPPVKLGCNCVGGKATTGLIKYLSHGGTLVTYGAMSKQPLTVGASSLIFNDIRIRGFWLSRWKKMSGNTSNEWETMMDSLVDMCRKNVLLPPLHDEVSLDDYKLAISNAMKPYLGKKQIFVFK